MSKDISVSPQKLAGKLLQIRKFLNLSQTEMLKKLGFDERLFRSNISQYERGEREPPLLVLLHYARAIGISTDVLIDDEAKIKFESEEPADNL